VSRLFVVSVIAAALLGPDDASAWSSERAGPTASGTQTGREPRIASALDGKLRLVLRGRRLTVVYRGRVRRSSIGYALHNNRVRYACYTSLWASVGEDIPPGSKVARARTTRPLRRGRGRKTVVLDRAPKPPVGACVLESLRLSYRFDIAVGLFVPPGEFVRRDAPGPPDLAPRPGERLLDSRSVGTPGASLFIGERTLRIVLADEAPISLQRDFRTQSLNVFCSDRRGLGPGQGLGRTRFPPRPREVVAHFRAPIAAVEGVTCGVETETTGTEAFGSVGEPGILRGVD
jgi:hypothetical protein